MKCAVVGMFAFCKTQLAVQGVPHRSPNDSWNWIQQPCDPKEEKWLG